MSDFRDDLLRTLQRATSEKTTDEALGRNEAELHEAWNGLARWLRLAEEPFSADQFLENLELATKGSPSKWQHVLRRAGGLLAVAACMTMIVVWGPRAGSHRQTNSTAEQTLVQSGTTEQLTWDDSVDEQLFNLQEQIRFVYWSNGDAQDGASSFLDDLDAFDIELHQSEL
jgi:hypothetical protein